MRFLAARRSVSAPNPHPAVRALQRVGLRLGEVRALAWALRHSYCSALATGGLPATTLARVTGHSDPGFTYRVYARDGRGEAAFAADVLARAAGSGFGR